MTDLDALSFDEVQQMKYGIWSTPETALFATAAPARRIVAEGDSWFDYPVGLDVLDCLKRDHGYEIFKVAQAGDSLENMVYGTGYRDNFNRRTPPIETTLRAIEAYNPVAFLFSGGGNDIAGAELEAYLNHRNSGLNLLREEYVEYIFSTVVKGAYRHLIERVGQVSPSLPIITHGYAVPIPDGRSVRIVGIRFAGPWLRPAFTRKNIVEAGTAREVMRTLVTRFNDTLAELARENPNFHYIDVRQEVGDGDWANELHPKNGAFCRVADRFHQKIEEVTRAEFPPV